MKLGENLQTIRKQNGLSQEELADKLDVSRQSVSKWESGTSYPELEKIIMICDMFQCSIDELVKDGIEQKFTKEKNEYDNFMRKFGTGIAFAIFLILLGVTLMLTIMALASSKEAFEKCTMIGSAVLLLFVVIAVPIFITFGLQMEQMQKKYKEIPNMYSEKEIEQYNQKFAIIIATTVSIILVGVLVLLLLYGLQFFHKNSLFPIVIFMMFITVSVPFIVNAGIQKSKYEMILYKQCHESKLEEKLIGKVSAVIMICATILYFILGFVLELWKLSWLVFPIGGMFCGIVSVIYTKNF